MKDIRNYFLVFFALAYDDIPFFTYAHKGMWFILIIMLLPVFLSKTNNTIGRKVIFGLVAIWIIAILQFLVFKGITPSIVYRPLMILFTPFLFFKIMGLKFFKYMFNLIFYITIVSFTLWVLQNSVYFIDILLNKIVEFLFPYSWDVWPRSMIIHTIGINSIEQLGLYRYYGFFHEPGGSGIYIVLAIIINTIFTKSLFGKKNIFLLIAAFATFSTTVYIMIFILIGFWLFWNNKGVFSRIVTVGLFLGLFYLVFFRAEFMMEKIDNRFSTQMQLQDVNNKKVRGRFYSFFKTVEAFRRNPVIGTGFLSVNKYEDVNRESSFGYGITGVFAKFGVVLGIFYIVFFYKGLKTILYLADFKSNKYFALTLFIIFQIGLATQLFTYHIAFMIIVVYGLENKSLRNNAKSEYSKKYLQ